MKKIKKIYLILMACFTMMAVSSCNDFLKETMISDVSSLSFYVTEDGMQKALSSSYSFLKNQYFGQLGGLYLTLYGTDIYSMGATGNDYTAIDQYLFDSQESYMKNLWISMYKAINQCNAVVGRASESTNIDDAVKTKYMAEARFLRALYYFILIRQWGDVHLSLEETLGVETEANRTSRTEIYEKAIIPDLEYAVQHLPARQSENGRATKGAAQFLLSKVYLHRGWLSASNSDFQQAITLIEAVIRDGGYSLLPDYASLWELNNEINDELIWSVQNTIDPILNGNGNRAHMLFLGHYDQVPGLQRTLEYGRPWRRFNPTIYTLSRWDRQYDARYFKSFQHVWYANNPANLLPGQQVGDTALFFPGVNVGEKYYLADENGNRVEKTLTESYVAERHNILFRIYTPAERNGEANTGYDIGSMFPTLYKFLDPRRPDVNTETGTRDWVVMRLGEAYLIAAEAYFKTGNNEKAAEMLNVVRRRAAWPGFEDQMDINASDVTLEFILDERARELLGEDERWYDLTRTGTLVDRVKKYHFPTNGLNYAETHIQEKHTLRPIPQDQIDKCSNEYPQNSGY
jgi:hypothetical protein